MRRYKNKRTYLNARKRKEYNKYLRIYREKRKKLEEKRNQFFQEIKHTLILLWLII